MSILKFENRTPKNLSDMIKYLTNPEKTIPEGIFGIGCNPETVFEEMKLVQRIYHRDRLTHEYLQIIFAFDENISLSLCKIKEICVKIGNVLVTDQRQVFGAVHFLGKHLHCHFIINYVGIDGSLYKQKFSVWTYKNLVNEILSQYGLQKIKIFEG